MLELAGKFKPVQALILVSPPAPGPPMSSPPELPPPAGSGAPPELTGRQKTLQALERRRRFQNGKPEPGREWEDDQRWWGPAQGSI